MESERYHEMQSIREAAAPDSPARIQATKWLAERYGKTKAKASKRGRPSKAEKARVMAQSKEDKEDLKEDLANIGKGND